MIWRSFKVVNPFEILSNLKGLLDLWLLRSCYGMKEVSRCESYFSDQLLEDLRSPTPRFDLDYPSRLHQMMKATARMSHQTTMSQVPAGKLFYNVIEMKPVRIIIKT